MRRPRGTGRIYRQKDTSLWWIKFYRNGEPFRESTGTSDKRKATRALNLRLAEVTTGNFIGPTVERTPSGSLPKTSSATTALMARPRWTTARRAGVFVSSHFSDLFVRCRSRAAC
jgi:hypothetical protein